MRSRLNHRRIRRGFTLVELSVVILIIGILTSFLLVVSFEGARRANEKATQALILKLDTAVGDRLEALQTIQAPVTNGHRLLAMSVVPAAPPRFLDSEDRAQLIANIDFLKREMPDVFFVQADRNYPLNFGAVPFDLTGISPGAASAAPGVGGPLNPYLSYILPLGNSVQIAGHYLVENKAFVPVDLTVTPPRPPEALGESQWNRFPPLTGGPTYKPAGQGIFGASYQAMAAFTKQLGYAPIGTNGVDDDGDGLVDELDGEGNGTASGDTVDPVTGQNRGLMIRNRLAGHRHETARSEALYALLVEGQGPFGSIFSPDDFTSREVGDTDGDGLLEFIDAWGKPIQFFRWPVYYTTELGSSAAFQMGLAPYLNGMQTRQTNPLDPNQLLLSPAWWANLAALAPPANVYTSAQMSRRSRLFSQLFFSLVDPFADVGSAGDPPGMTYWDRSAYLKRRAYFSKYLIISGGSDSRIGLGVFDVDFSEIPELGVPSPYGVSVPNPATNPLATARLLNLVEAQAAKYDPVVRAAVSNAGAAGLHQGLPSTDLVAERFDATWAADDIANLTVRSAATGVR